MIIKYIVLGLVCCLTLYLIIDTTVYVVRKVRERRKKKDNENKTE